MSQSITFKVSIDCEACKKRIKKALNGIQGVETIDVDMKNERVTVVGFVEPKVIAKCLEKIGKKVDLPGGKNHYISNEGIDSLPFNNGFNFGKGGNKNKNGLNGKMLLADGDGEVDPATSDTYTHIFSDENANSCSLM